MLREGPIQIWYFLPLEVILYAFLVNLPYYTTLLPMELITEASGSKFEYGYKSLCGQIQRSDNSKNQDQIPAFAWDILKFLEELARKKRTENTIYRVRLGLQDLEVFEKFGWDQFRLMGLREFCGDDNQNLLGFTRKLETPAGHNRILSDMPARVDESPFLAPSDRPPHQPNFSQNRRKPTMDSKSLLPITYNQFTFNLFFYFNFKFKIQFLIALLGSRDLI